MKDIKNIVDAIEDSLINYLQIVAANGRRPFILNNELGWVKTFPTAWSNFIFYANFDYNEIDSQIEQLCLKMEQGEIPDEWVVGPKSSPPDLGKYLEKHNIIKQYSMAGMAVDIAGMNTTITIPDNLYIETADTKSKLELWADIVSRGLWNGQTFESCLFEDLISNPDCKFYIAYLNGEAVASSMLMLSHGVAGVDMVSTIRQYQGMGIGTAMTVTPLLYAKDKGYTIGVLQASEAGEPVYRKIGFEEYCRFHVYKYQIHTKK